MFDNLGNGCNRSELDTFELLRLLQYGKNTPNVQPTQGLCAKRCSWLQRVNQLPRIAHETLSLTNLTLISLCCQTCQVTRRKEFAESVHLLRTHELNFDARINYQRVAFAGTEFDVVQFSNKF